MTRARQKQVLPVLVVAGAVAVALALTAMRPPIHPRPVEPAVPLVRVVPVRTARVRLDVETEGTVRPRTESELVPEVSGRVVWLSPAMAGGGFFEADEPLVRLDAADYETAVRRAAATAAGLRSQARLAARNRDRSRTLARDGLISRATLDDAENAARVAAASLAEAEAALDRARRDLERTTLRAPYAGRVRTESVDIGQFVERGRPIAQLYAVDYAEVRLPVTDAALRDLALPLAGRVAGRGPLVELRADFAGAPRRWSGRVVRTEGEIDPVTRMVHVVAQVGDPYGRRRAGSRAPLAAGMFVRATIHGRVVADAVVLPREALRPNDRVWVVTPAGALRARPVRVVRRERERVVIAGGLAPGERVCVSPVEGFVDGMPVRVAGAA